MLDRLRACDPTLPLTSILFYRAFYWLLMGACTVAYRLRMLHTDRLPRSGGVLVVANHQSLLDPPMIGLGFRHRNMAAMARSGLFKIPVLGWWLRAVGCICLKENESDTAAMRRAISELKKGRLVLIFPEGARTLDGQIHEFKRGAWLLMSRAGCDVVPAAIEGAFDAWPRTKPLPRIIGKRCAVAFGKPISHEELRAMKPDEGLARLRNEVIALREELQRSVFRGQNQN